MNSPGPSALSLAPPPATRPLLVNSPSTSLDNPCGSPAWCGATLKELLLVWGSRQSPEQQSAKRLSFPGPQVTLWAGFSDEAAALGCRKPAPWLFCFDCTTPEQEARADICCFGRPASTARLFLAKVPQLPHGEFPPCVQPGEGAARPDAPSFRATGWACSPGWVNSPPSPRMGHSFLVMMPSPKGVTESPLLSKMLRLHPHWGLSASPVLLPF